MKKIIHIIVVFVLMTAWLCGCGAQTIPLEQSAGKVKIVCTTFPQYDWVMNLLGEEKDQFSVSLLVKNSSDWMQH